MKRVLTFFCCSFILLALGIFSGVEAKSEKSENPSAKTMKHSKTTPPQLSPEQEAMMKEMEQWSLPGADHKVLDVLVGKWNHQVRWWMKPDSQPEESRGTNVNRWIMGNRFLQQEVSGKTSMGKHFEGIGLTGYDLLKKEYNSVWIDNMSTGMMVANASYDVSSKTFSETGTFSCPMTKEKGKSFRANWKIQDQNHYSYEMYVKSPEGKEYKSLEIAYERAGRPKVSQR